MTETAIEATAAPGWQPLPARAARLDAVQGLIGTAVFPGALIAAGWWILDFPGGIAAALAWPLLCALLGARVAWRRTHRTRWRLDRDGLGLRRDLWWQQETRVPVSRVQHLDVRRGPLQRRAGLATLVVHTAGSRFSAVVVAGLDHHDAEHLRDTLARQLDQDADAL